MKKFLAFLTVISVFFLTPLGISFDAEAESGYGWGFKKSENHEVPDVGKYKEILDDYGAYYADHSDEKVIYLTFDNGYEEGYTNDILDVLKKHDVPATFFITGNYAENEPELVKRMVDEGHIIGNHSYHHPDFTVVNKENMKKELEDLEEKVGEITDQEEITYMRPPQGMFNEQTLDWANELDYIHIFWSLAFVDWETDEQKGWKYAYDNIMEQIHPGAIMLLHTVSADNAKALDKTITDLKKEGYEFKSLDHLVMKDKLPDPIYGY